MAMTKVLAFERDEDGQLPRSASRGVRPVGVHEDHRRARAADGVLHGFPPSYFGQTTTANPASADAIRVSLNQLDRAGGQVQRQATPHVRKFMQLLWRFANGGASLPDEMTRLEVDWVDPATPTPGATSDAITKQIAVGCSRRRRT
jgi:hypothetical protein